MAPKPLTYVLSLQRVTSISFSLDSKEEEKAAALNGQSAQEFAGSSNLLQYYIESIRKEKIYIYMSIRLWLSYSLSSFFWGNIFLLKYS